MNPAKNLRKKLKKGVDEEKPPVVYYDSRADEGSGNGESPQNQERRRMYPENYTMQNTLEFILTSQMQHR